MVATVVHVGSAAGSSAGSVVASSGASSTVEGVVEGTELDNLCKLEHADRLKIVTAATTNTVSFLCKGFPFNVRVTCGLVIYPVEVRYRNLCFHTVSCAVLCEQDEWTLRVTIPPNPDLTVLKVIIGRARVNAGMTIEELAEASGVSRQTILNLGSGSITAISRLG